MSDDSGGESGKGSWVPHRRDWVAAAIVALPVAILGEWLLIHFHVLEWTLIGFALGSLALFGALVLVLAAYQVVVAGLLRKESRTESKAALDQLLLDGVAEFQTAFDAVHARNGGFRTLCDQAKPQGNEYDLIWEGDDGRIFNLKEDLKKQVQAYAGSRNPEDAGAVAWTIYVLAREHGVTTGKLRTLLHRRPELAQKLNGLQPWVAEHDQLTAILRRLNPLVVRYAEMSMESDGGWKIWAHRG